MTEKLVVDDTAIIQAIERVKQGDSFAFGLIYERYIDSVLRYCRRNISWGDRSLHFNEDLANEVMFSLWTTLVASGYDWRTIGELQRVIHRLANEHCINRGKFAKRLKRRKDADLESLFTKVYGRRSQVTGIEEVDLSDLLELILEKIPQRELQAYTAMRIQGLTNDEISEKCRITIRTVRRRMADSLNIIKKLIAKEAGK